MRRFLELYQEARSPTFLADDFRRAIGPEAVDALLDATILTRSELSDWYPCDGAYPGCPRRIVANIGDRTHPLVAVCGEPTPMCRPIPVRAEHLEQYTASHETFARALKQLLGLDGELTLLDDSYPDCAYLGESHRAGASLDVFLCRASWDSAFEALLADRSLAARRSIVLAPTPRGVPFDLIHRYSPGNHVTLALLVDVVGLHGGKLVLRPNFDELIDGRRERDDYGWSVITQTGRKRIDSKEYADLVAHPEEFDLLLDEVAAEHSRTYAASYRDQRGTLQSAALSALQIRALVELISRGIPLRATEFRCMQAAAVQNPAKIIEAARRAVDVRLSRYGWRSFHTLAGESLGQRRYVFRPPASLRYACIFAGELRGSS